MPLDASGTASRPSPHDEAKPEPPIPERRIIAVVDDDEAVCNSIRTLLEVYDFVVRTYLSAAAFLEEKPAVSCIVVDYFMPGLNGLELVSRLRSRGSSTPVIMITASSDARIESLAAQLGVKRVLKKPLGKALITSLQEELGQA